ncbi:MAG: ABC transporter ATP-binding protein [Paracoccus sp. (in: a-proteobacteria)]|nr:ABC transporter ATP-binding protein [Paracoccus sp. (in: a-proteobacteria)]
MLEISRITAGHGPVQVLHGVSLRVGPGRVHALLGRNGAGKTTLLRRVMGFLPQASGRVVFDGHDITHWPTPRIARARIGYVPEGREVFQTLSLRENLTLAGRIGRGDWTIARVGALFDNLATGLDRPAGVLSGGEQQMLAIGRALMTSPRMLLLDEPSEGLSVQMLDRLAGALTTLKAGGMAILLVEQNIALARALADEITLISRGEVVWSGDAPAFDAADEARARYLGVGVAG